MSQKFVYSMVHVGKMVPPSKMILRDLSLSFYAGAKIGVLGLNGAGKSTLLRIMAGVDTQFQGEARPGDGVRMGFLQQEPLLDAEKTVREVIEEGASEILKLKERFEAISAFFLDENLDPDKMEKLLEEQADIQGRLEHLDAWELDRKLEMAMEALRCPPPETPVAQLSGGEKRRVALCRLLIDAPDFLLLDEPTNHLDAESVSWLESFLKHYTGTVVAVTHDRYFLDNIAGWILELDRGHGIPWKGNYSSWLEQKQERVRLEEKQESKRQQTLQRELEWVRLSPKARQAKNKARIHAYERLVAEDRPEKQASMEIYIPSGPRLGDLVVEAKGLRKAFKNKLLFENLSFKVPRGSLIGVVGGNGAGKTTLFRMITGTETPDQGSLSLGETVKLAYVDQSRDALNGEWSVWEEISDGKNEVIRLGSQEVNSRAYCARFNFTGADQQKLVKHLSGGERNRVHLAKLLKSGANLLLLDEPTNDLDVNTLRALEEALLHFSGSAMVISHDRWFLDRIATHILAFEGDSQVIFFEGNYTEYEEDLRKRRPDTREGGPKRVRFKPLPDLGA